MTSPNVSDRAPFACTGSATYGLALHTTTPELGLVIDNSAGDRRCQTWHLERAMSAQLQLYLAEFIRPQTWQDLAFLAVAQGPGSFTGTRIGVVTARTLAQQLQIPLFAISTSLALAWADRDQVTEATDLIVQIPAQRGEVFVAVYRKAGAGLTTILPDTGIRVATWQQKLAQWDQAYHLIQAGDRLGSSVQGVLDCAAWKWQQGDRPDWINALPFYGQSAVQ